MMLKRLKPEEVPYIRRDPVDVKARSVAEPIVEAVKNEGEAALRRYAEQFDGIAPGGKLIISQEELKAAYNSLPEAQRAMLERTAARIRAFAAAQRESIQEVTIGIPGGEAGHTVAAVEAAGCYAPGGRYPLPSTVLMTAVTARVAGCKRVVCCSPRPSNVTLAAAYVAKVDIFLAVGGAHAIAALAYGAGALLEPCDAVVGPGNMFVTAAKALVAGRVAIDMLAGPSEVLVLADEKANPVTVARDILAQAEHDPVAIPAVICLSERFAAAVDAEIAKQLKTLPTADIASQSLKNGYTVVVDSVAAGAEMCDRLAIEHLELHVEDAMKVAKTINHYGGLFIGDGAAEVLGDYGAGPNHTLPTGGTARSTGGLCVLTFMRVRTWMRVDDRIAAKRMTEDAVMLAELEGLFGHAEAAKCRLPPPAGELEAVSSVPSSISTRENTLTDRLIFAVPKKGRMMEKCLQFISAAGLEYTRRDRVDVATVTNLPITLVFLPAADIAEYVGKGNVDIGITGEDIVAESQLPVTVGLKLGFGKCKLALQVPEVHKSKPLSAYVGSRIVTSFPNVTKKFFDPLDAARAAADPTAQPTEIRTLSGSIEAACGLGLADAVVDLVETGTTMRAAGLDVLADILETQAVLITNPHTKHPELAARLITRIQGYINSTKFQLMQYNVPRTKLADAVKITPGKKSPSILPLDDDKWVAVSVMVAKKEVPDILEKLDAAGATDILVFSLTNCRV